MLYSQLPEEVRAKLEANFEVLLKYSDVRDQPQNTVLGTMIVAKDSTIEPKTMAGFDYRGDAVDAFRQWFEFDTKDKSDEEASRLALNALMLVDPAFATEGLSASGEVDPMTEAKESDVAAQIE